MVKPSPTLMRVPDAHPPAMTIPMPKRMAPMVVCKPTGLIKPGGLPPPLTAAYWTAPKPREAMATAMMTAFASEVLPVRNGSRKAAAKQNRDFWRTTPKPIPITQEMARPGDFPPQDNSNNNYPQEHDYCRRELVTPLFACPDRNPLSYRCFCFHFFLLLILSFYTFFLFSRSAAKCYIFIIPFFTKNG